MRDSQKKNLKRLLNPKQIAFIGGNDAAIAMREAKRIGYSGELWPVNPNRDTLGGIACFKTLDDLPSAPDAVFLAVPLVACLKVIDQLSQMGAGGIVCYSAGFKESGSRGEEAEKIMINTLGDTVLVGPNCYGIINYLDQVALWPFAHGGWSPGFGVAIITQSGMLSSDITMSQRSLPMGYMVSVGNQGSLQIADFVDCFSEDSSVRAIGVHIEGLTDIAKFEKAALKSLKMGKPIVVLKTGSSEIGRALTVSHTGSFAGSDTLYNALFERLGCVRVYDPSNFLETLKYFCISGIPETGKCAGFTCSGGGATMLADYAEKVNIEFSKFGYDEKVTLEKILPPIATVSNPHDYTTPIWGHPDLTKPVFEAAMKLSCSNSTILVQDYPMAGLDDMKNYYLNDAKAFAEAAKSQGIPAAICSTLPENFDKEVREKLISWGVTPLQGIHEGLNAISNAVTWGEKKKGLKENPYELLLQGEESGYCSYMTEFEAKETFRKAGFLVPKGVLVKEEQVLSAANQIGFPVVLKMMSPYLSHKTEFGAVALNLRNDVELRNSLIKMKKTVSEAKQEAITDEFLIEKMENKPVAEIVVAVRRDSQFGLVLTLGSGGIFTDLVSDYSVLLLPTDSKKILKTLNNLKAGKLINGFRGQEKCDYNPILGTILDLCRFLTNQNMDIYELEINPLFVYRKSVKIIDSLILKKSAKSSH